MIEKFHNTQPVPEKGIEEHSKEKDPTNLVYEKPVFIRENAPEYVESIKGDFNDFYASLGYDEHQPVLVSSGIDPTVRFIGSHISVLKPYLIEETIPTPGYFINQECVRTQNISNLFNDEHVSRWGSSFVSLGAISPATRLNEVCHEVAQFLEDTQGIKKDNIRIRISSQDEDLMPACVQYFLPENIEVDTQQPQYYRHKIGVDGVWGRNFNIALRNPSGEGFSDVGNIILIENAEKKLGVEVALGASTILKQLYNLDHVNDCYPITGLPSMDPKISRKLEDAIIVSTILEREGLEPSATGNRERILRTYVRSLSYFRSRANLTLDELSKVIYDFETRQFKESETNVSEKIVGYVKRYEEELLEGNPKTPEDKIIKEALSK